MLLVNFTEKQGQKLSIERKQVCDEIKKYT